MSLESQETWKRTQEKEFERKFNMKLNYWETHALALIASTQELSESDLMKQALIEKINSFGYSFECDLPKIKTKPQNLFAILQELSRKCKNNPQVKRAVMAVLNWDGRTD